MSEGQALASQEYFSGSQRLAFACEILYRGDMFIWDSTEDEKDAKSIVPDIRQD